MFENQTFETIMERMLSRISNDLDKREGGVIWDLLSPAAVELTQAYAEMDNVLNLGFADTTYGEYLDKRAAEQGIFRKPAVKATGYITVAAPQNTVIPIGTRFSTEGEEPIYFVSIEEMTVISDFVNVPVECEIGGVIGNVAAESITLLISDIGDITSVSNAEPFSNGIDEESDEELLKRYLEKVSMPSTSGNKYQYIQWAKEVNGIAEAKCYPLWDGPGTVKVVVINPQKRSPAQSTIDEVIAHIEEVRPIGAEVTVVGVTEVPIDISVKLTLRDNTNLEQVRLNIIDNATKYFQSVAFVDDVVRYTAIGNAILDANGVIDYENLQINSQSGNIILQQDAVPVIGALNITT